MNDIVLKWSKTKPNPTNVPNTGTIRYNLDYRKNNNYRKNKNKADINPLHYFELHHNYEKYLYQSIGAIYVPYMSPIISIGEL